MSQVRAGAAYVELLTRDASFVKGLEAAKKRLNNFAASTKLLGTKLVGLGIAATAPLAGSVAVFASFDDAMRGVAAITQATETQLESLRNTAKHLGATTSFSASEVASLMTELGRAGFNPAQIEKMTAAVMNLSRATGTDATQASGIMAATIRQFGMEASESTRVADGLTAAANKSFNTVESLGEALSYAGPVAADANMSLEETLAILGTLGNVGIQGSEAGTAMRRLLTLSAAESKKFQKVFGVVTKDASGNARSLVDILGEVAAATANMGTAERAEKFNEVFGLLGITSASAIGKSVSDTRELLKTLQAAGGVAKKTAEEMEGGIGGAFRILKSSIEAVAIAIGESLEGDVKRLTEAFSKAASGLVEWIGKNQQIVKTAAISAVAIIGIGAALITVGGLASAAAFAIGGFASILSFVGASLGVIVGAVAMLFTPLGAVVAAVAAMGGYFLWTSGIAGEAVAYLKGVFETLKADTIAAFGGIATALSAGDITAAADVMWSYLKLQWTKGTTFIQNLWAGFTNYLASVWSDSAFSIGDILISALSGLQSAWSGAMGFMADAWTILTSSVQIGWNNTIAFLKKGFVQLYELVDIAGDVSVQIGGVLVDALAGVESAWVETVDYLADTWTVFVGQVKSMWNSTVGFLQKAWIKLKGLFDEDIDVDAEIQRIDKDLTANDTAEKQNRQQAINERMQRRGQRKAEIEANRKQMQEGIAEQLEARRRERETRDPNADMSAIDAAANVKNNAVRSDRDSSIAQNADAARSRQAEIDRDIEAKRKALDAMRAEAIAARASSDPSSDDRGAKVAVAQADFDAAVKRANEVKAPGEVPAADDGSVSPPPPSPKPPGQVPMPKPSDLIAPEIEAPLLAAPNDKDLELSLARDAKDSIDAFGQDTKDSQVEVAGAFDTRGLAMGSGASKLAEPVRLEPDTLEPQRVPAPLLRTDDPALPDAEVKAEEPNLVRMLPDDAMPSDQSLDIESLNLLFNSLGQSLADFDAAISSSTSNLRMPTSIGDGITEDMKRAIIQTADNTRRLVERASTGGLVFS